MQITTAASSPSFDILGEDLPNLVITVSGCMLAGGLYVFFKWKGKLKFVLIAIMAIAGIFGMIAAAQLKAGGVWQTTADIFSVMAIVMALLFIYSLIRRKPQYRRILRIGSFLLMVFYTLVVFRLSGGHLPDLSQWTS